MTYTQIAAQFRDQGIDVTPQAVSVAASRAGQGNRRPRYSEWLPWRVSNQHTMSHHALMLRAYGRWKNAGEDWGALRPDQRQSLRNWLATLQDQRKVVNYTRERGFFLVAARPGEQIIRRPTASAASGRSHPSEGQLATPPPSSSRRPGSAESGDPRLLEQLRSALRTADLEVAEDGEIQVVLRLRVGPS